MENTKDIFPINLQLFAADGSGEANQGGESESQDAQKPAAQPRTYTEEELQTAIDSAVKQRLAREKRDAEKRIEQAREEARSEAEKLARMNEEQRAEHERQRAEKAAQEREAAIAKREADITRRELRAEAIDTLHKRGLPAGLEAVLNYSDADACSASIDTVEKVFREAVQQGVDERLKQSGVRLSLGNADAAMNAAMRRAAGLPD